MNARSKRVECVAALVLLAGGAGWLMGGPLNPPGGPVSAGGKTTQEIYDAVTGISGSIGTIGGRGPAVPGGNTAAGTVSFSGGQPLNSAIIGMRLSVATSGGPATVQNGGITIVRSLAAGNVASWRMLTTGQIFTATITVPSTGGNTVYVLTSCVVRGYRDYLVQRADGTFAAIEEVDLFPTDLRVTDPTGGATYHHNFGTNTGGV